MKQSSVRLRPGRATLRALAAVGRRRRPGQPAAHGRRYGDVSFWQFLYVSTYFFAHPDEIESVLVTQHRSFTKGIGTRANPELFGNGLLTSEGEFWLRQRRLSQPAFHRTRIAAYADIMVREAERRLDGWRDGEELDIHREMMETTLAIATRTLFGVDLGPKMPVVADALTRSSARMRGSACGGCF